MDEQQERKASTRLKPDAKLSSSYEFSEVIGSGGMGVIYKARHPILKKLVAVKILHQINAQTVMRFQREAQAATNLHHENVIAVHEFGVTKEGQPYMVMDFLEGKSLAELIAERGALHQDLCLHIFDQLCNGIAHAHSKGVLHRDLKPSNIMLIAPESWKPQVQIVDFGIAKVLSPEGGDLGKLTQTGDIIGSPLYMSPEQCLGKDIDFRSDIYSIGCVMFEALTGKPPIVGETMMETMLKQMNDKAPLLNQARSGKDFPVWLERLVERALQKDPQQRFQSVKELKTALERRIVPDPNSTSAAASAAHFHSWNKAPRFAVPLCAVLLLAVACAVALHLTHSPPNTATTLKAQSNVNHDDTAATSKLTDDLLNDPNAATKAMIEDTSNDTITNVDRQPITDEALLGLKDRIDVKVLRVPSSRITEAALRDIVHLPLVALILEDNKRITNKALEILTAEGSRTIAIEELSVAKTSINDAGLRYIPRFYKLENLNLRDDGITNAGLVNLKRLKNLAVLKLGGNQSITDAGLANLSELTNLDSLELRYTSVNGSGLNALKNLRYLRSLFLTGTPTNDAALAAIKQLPVMSLELDFTKVSSEGVGHLREIKTLKVLNLNHVGLSAEAIASLSTMPLNSLEVAATGLTDQDLIQLANCKSLRKLNLSQNPKITGRGLKALAVLPLTELRLSRNFFNDRDLMQLAECKGLRALHLDYCRNISSAGVTEFRRFLPECLIFPADTP